jgi:putative ABC transport system ATP-binding protein
MTKPIIEIKDVWKTYTMGDNILHVLKGVNLTIHKKEFIAILGPSGSGKSTLMNQIGVLDIPTRGKVLLDGHDISTLDESELAKIRGQKIGFIFQQFNLIPTLSALENVLLPTLFQDDSKEEQKERAMMLLTRMGLADRTHHKPSELSGGQQQRVAIARALINDPDIILADEPTGNLDSASGKDVMKMLTDLHHNEGKTIILVTHDTHLINYSKRTIYLKDGEIEKITNHNR